MVLFKKFFLLHCFIPLLIFTLLNPLFSSKREKEAETALFLEEILTHKPLNTALLTLFFSQIPKGGDLHHHFSGSIYAETYLNWAKEHNQYINPQTSFISKKSMVGHVPINKLFHYPRFLNKILSKWSLIDRVFSHSHPPSVSSHFFQTFSYFDNVIYDLDKALLLLKNRAIKENVIYIETILHSIPYLHKNTHFNQRIQKKTTEDTLFPILDKEYTSILADPLFSKTVDAFLHSIESAHNRSRIDSNDFKMRYQLCAHRNKALSAIFASLCAGFVAAHKSSLIVGMNILGPEHHPIALKNYHLHMLFFSYFKHKFPDVKISLHAGELALGLAPSEHLQDHISQALFIGKAKRIGHGVDLPHENNALNILNFMKTNQIAVEINLTSNEFLLGISHEKHPYTIYSKFNIPTVICTDDSGVFRNNLSKEYSLLAQRYKPSYTHIKENIYNTIHCSFLSNEDKNHMLHILDEKFESFELNIASCLFLAK